MKILGCCSFFLQLGRVITVVYSMSLGENVSLSRHPSPSHLTRGPAWDGRADISKQERGKPQQQTRCQNACLVRMDEERKTRASHDEMCFPDWLNEAPGIKGVNQLLQCLGSTWAGLLMRQERPSAGFPAEAANLHPQVASQVA